MIPSRRFCARLTESVLSGTLLLASVCVAAVAAHFAIDVVGDFALPHDDYDGIVHSSRLGICAAAIAFALAAVAGLLWSALDDARRRRATPQRPLVASPLVFGGAIVLLSVVATMGMEWLDVRLSGTELDGFAGALGGSVALGLSITLPIAASVAWLVLRVARFMDRARIFIAEAVVALVTVLRCAGQSNASRSSREAFAPRIQLLAVYLGRAHKRGPPLTA